PKVLVTGLYVGHVILLGWACVVTVSPASRSLSSSIERLLVGSATSERPKRHQNHHRADHDPAGFVALGINLRTGERPHNFTNVFESTTNSSYGLVMAFLNITWSYIGYSNVNYGFSETKRPVRKFKTAAALALTSAVIRKRPQPPGRK
ncbi:hypothetical protein S7711_09503, partial [Stachybotrys chartarum IBT 7711]